MKAGADLGVQSCSAAALMMARVEAGMIMGELEYDHTVSPYECRMGWAVDLEKGPWLGPDALKARKDLDTGRVVTVRVDGDADAADGARLLKDGTDVGHVTMAVPSPTPGRSHHRSRPGPSRQRGDRGTACTAGEATTAAPPP